MNTDTLFLKIYDPCLCTCCYTFRYTLQVNPDQDYQFELEGLPIDTHTYHAQEQIDFYNPLLNAKVRIFLHPYSYSARISYAGHWFWLKYSRHWRRFFLTKVEAMAE